MARTPSTMPEIGTALEKRPLQHTDGSLFSWELTAGKPVLVAFLSNHCPFVQHILDAFTHLANAVHPDVFVVAVNANNIAQYPQDGPAFMQQLAVEKGWKFPFLLDETQEFAKVTGAACTPDFFLFDATHRLVYRGQMDGSRPGNGVVPSGDDLRKALEAVLHGKAVPEPQVPSLGCNIKWKPGNEPAYFSR